MGRKAKTQLPTIIENLGDLNDLSMLSGQSTPAHGSFHNLPIPPATPTISSKSALHAQHILARVCERGVAKNRVLETKPQQGAGKPINLCTFEQFRYPIVSKFHPLLFSIPHCFKISSSFGSLRSSKNFTVRANLAFNSCNWCNSCGVCSC